MNSHKQLKLRELGVAYGVISGFPVHCSYPLGDREQLDKLFRGDYFAWEAMSKAAHCRCATSDFCDPALVTPGPSSLYSVDGWWEYKGRQIVDRGFILFAPLLDKNQSPATLLSGASKCWFLRLSANTEPTVSRLIPSSRAIRR